MCVLLIWLQFFDSLGGHCSLQTALEVRTDLRFEISDLNYLHIHVHIAYMVWNFFDSLGGLYSLQTASEVRSDLRFEICGPNCICNHVCLGCLGLWKFQRRLRKMNRPLLELLALPQPQLKKKSSVQYVGEH